MAEEQVRPAGSPSRRRGLWFWVKITFGCAVLVAGGLYLVRSWTQVSRALAEMGWLPMVGALLPAAGGGIAAMLAWRALLTGLGSSLPVRDTGRVFFFSQLGKYLPGSVWAFLAQIELARERNVPRAVSLAVSVLAVVLSLTVGLGIALVTLPFGALGPLLSLLWGGLWWLLLAVPVLLVVLHPRVTVGALNLVLRLLRRGPLTVRPSPGQMTRAAVWQTLSWCLLGLHCYLLVLGFGADPARALPLAIGGFALAYCAGVLFLPVPAGLGIRELILAASLAVVLTRPQALAVVLVSRFALVLVDLALAAAWWLGSQRPERQRPERQRPERQRPERQH